MIGMNVRFPPYRSRTLVEEIAFARSVGFDCVQFAVRQPGDFAAFLGTPLETVVETLQVFHLSTVMEIIVRIDIAGRNAIGQTPLEVLEANLPIIRALSCTCVHWHLVPLDRASDPATLMALEESLLTQFKAGGKLAERHNFRFGFEHNEPILALLATPERCSWLLDAVPGLGFVWDLNHTIPEHRDGFLSLTPRMTMLHVSDTPLPIVNHHLPLGEGSIDFAAYCAALQEQGFHGPAILEIGGLPQSGGYGKDTDAALIQSRELFAKAMRSDH